MTELQQASPSLSLKPGSGESAAEAKNDQAAVSFFRPSTPSESASSLLKAEDSLPNNSIDTRTKDNEKKLGRPKEMMSTRAASASVESEDGIQPLTESLRIRKHGVGSPAETPRPARTKSRRELKRRTPAKENETESTAAGQYKPDRSIQQDGDSVLRIQKQGQTEPQKPWGLSTEDMRTMDSYSEPHSARDVQHEHSSQLSHAQAVQIRSSTEKHKEKALTHVNSSGEAHMVNVGTKADSKRVAIATATVRFKNNQPFRLIFENNNKKGDVLGVARIAGIMAAKRTSDLIPLCHPIAISKVEVDVTLEPPGTSTVFLKSNDNGAVTIRAQVECSGPTGVEMEALTAASVAGMTVYDMCKAVDRDMMIIHNKVVYKWGGKSGLHFNHAWAWTMPKAFFNERDLPVPEISARMDGKGVVRSEED